MGNDCFYQTNGVSLNLGAGFDTSEDINEKTYLISNSKESKSAIYAPEINFYHANSLEKNDWNTRNIRTLYKVRAYRYDYAQDVESSVRVGQRVAIIQEGTITDVTSCLKEQGYDVQDVSVSSVSQIVGTLGRFKINVKNGDEVAEIPADQIVWAVDTGFDREVIGMYDLNSLGLQNLLNTLEANSGVYKYKHGVTYNSSLCLQKNKRTEVCGNCVDVCPQSAISMAKNNGTIEVSHIQCDSCGACVSGCPTGALDYASLPRDGFSTVDTLYNGSIALVIGENTLKDTFSCTLPEKVLPLVVDSPGFIDEDHLLSLVYSSGYPVLLWQDELFDSQRDCIDFVNSIFTAIYNRQAVYVCATESEITHSIKLCEKLPLEQLCIPDSALGKRDRISQRLLEMVGDDDFGQITPAASTPYGTIKVNSDNCTLCLSCVDACTPGALIAHAEDNTLRFTPSSCVQCGHCETICPENDCLEVVYNQLELHKGFFASQTLAQDELFACIECGEGFAPAKSIEKIIALMTPAFGDDSLRIKSLSCCPDCKAKVMLEALTADI